MTVPLILKCSIASDLIYACSGVQDDTNYVWRALVTAFDLGGYRRKSIIPTCAQSLKQDEAILTPVLAVSGSSNVKDTITKVLSVIQDFVSMVIIGNKFSYS
jgi:hypothetical protein